MGIMSKKLNQCPGRRFRLLFRLKMAAIRQPLAVNIVPIRFQGGGHIRNRALIG